MTFDAGRLRGADWIVAAGAVALFVFVFFFDWFGGGISGLLPGSHISGATSSTTGWQTFASSRWIWLATILVALGSALAAAAAYRLDGPVQLGALTAGLGAVSSALIVYRIVHHPSESLSIGRLHASYGIKIGIWLGLVAALMLTFGGYLQERAPAEPQAPSSDEPQAPPRDEPQAPAPDESTAAFRGLIVSPGERTPAARPPAPSGAEPGSRQPDDAP